jgi:hypothetical protein
MKNKILSVMLVLSILALFSSCSVGSMLVGTKWTDELSVFSFEKDGVLKVTVGDTTFNGTYSSEGSELTYKYKGLLKENTDTVIVEFGKTTMIWLDEDGKVVKTLRRLDD